ncbi:MAG: sulfite exporter TauE/SafE family protein, partial [Verrucomicrobiota bacterium]
MLPDLTAVQWLLAAIAGVGIGVSKSGLPGISLLHVVIFAQLFPGLASTGVVLPMLVCGDIGAVLLFRRDARWPHIARTLPPAVVGVAIVAFIVWAIFGPPPAMVFALVSAVSVLII